MAWHDALAAELSLRRLILNLRRVVCLVFALAFAGLASQAFAQEFPYDRDMVFETRPMRGGKRVPVLAIEPGGRTQIDLWCKRGQGQANESAPLV